MRRALLVSGIVALLLVAARLRIQASTAQPQCPEGLDLIGAWQSLEVTQAPTGGDTYDGRTAVLGKAGPGIRVFSKRHYAYLQVSNTAERNLSRSLDTRGTEFTEPSSSRHHSPGLPVTATAFLSCDAPIGGVLW